MQQQLKQLGLTQLEKALPTLYETAQAEQWTYEMFLRRAISAEIEGRDRRAAERRMAAARLPAIKTDGGRLILPFSQKSLRDCCGS